MTPLVAPCSQMVTLNELETILRRAGWLAWVVSIVMTPPVQHEVSCNGVRLIVRR